MQVGSITEEEVLKLAKDGYEKGEATFEINPRTCALLVIDMQDEFVKPHWTPFWVPEATRQVPRIKQLIECCRSNTIPIIYTVYAKTHQYLDRPTTLAFMPSRSLDAAIDLSLFFVDGKVWHELSSREEDIVIRKPSYGAFFDTPLETILKNRNKDTVIICGTLTNYCCSTTARQAFERGFKVVFGSDVTSAHFRELHETELKVLRRGFAKVLTLDSIIKAIRS